MGEPNFTSVESHRLVKTKWGSFRFVPSNHEVANTLKEVGDANAICMEGILNTDRFIEDPDKNLTFWENFNSKKQWRNIAYLTSVKHFFYADIYTGREYVDPLDGLSEHQIVQLNTNDYGSLMSILGIAVGAVLQEEAKFSRRAIITIGLASLANFGIGSINQMLTKLGSVLQIPYKEVNKEAWFVIFFRNLVTAYKIICFSEYLEKTTGEKQNVVALFGALHADMKNIIEKFKDRKDILKQMIEKIMIEVDKNIQDKNEVAKLRKSLTLMPFLVNEATFRQTGIFNTETGVATLSEIKTISVK